MRDKQRNKQDMKATKSLFKELPYHNYNIVNSHGRFNNLLRTKLPSKRILENLPSLYDLDIFKLNTACDGDDLLSDQRPQCRYFSPHSFKEFTEENAGDCFSVIHNNLVSLDHNLEHYQTHLLEELNFEFDVIGITETKITNSHSGPATKIPGYEFEYVPTPLSFGGVGLFIKESIKYTIIEKTSNEAFQALWIETHFAQQKNLIIGIIYRQHNTPESFLSYFEETLERLAATGKRILVMGDFNLCLLKSETFGHSHNFLSSVLSYGIMPMIDKPTRVRGNSASLIDNILVNEPDQVQGSGNILSDTSDHFSQFCIFKSKMEKTKPVKTKRRDFSKFSKTSFLNDLGQVDWDSLISRSGNDIDNLFSSFYKKLNKIVNKHAPIKQISRRQAKQLTKPWITRGIRASIKIKNKLFASGQEERYKYYRNKICRLTRISKRNYFNNYFNDNLTNMKKMWSGINGLLNRKGKNTKDISALKDGHNGDKTINEPYLIANKLNEHFATVGSNLASKIPLVEQTFQNYLNKMKPTENSFFFSPVTSDEVEHEILSIPNSKSHGLYSCPTELLKYSHKILSKTLASMFNLSISLGKFPSKLKQSKIIPIFKSDDKTDPNNYRPISLLSNFNKIFEKLMYSRMKTFITKTNIFNTSQYGFREGHSTEHAILDLVSNIQANMDKGLYSCGVFIDLKKAFDTVDHTILLQKLHFYGFRGIINDWFKSYLCNRTQTTQIGSLVSEKRITGCGVPQGSILGPLLFLIYINDIHKCSEKLQFFIFADDTNVLYSDKNLKSIEIIVNNELHNLYLWLTCNKLTLNIKKSNFVIFHPRQKKPNYKPQINIYDNEKNKSIPLDNREYIKYLGILIDQNLSWKVHIDNIVTKASKLIGLIAKLRHIVPFHTLLTIYRSLILPFFTYGITVWGQACESYLNKILTLQKRVIRLVYFADKKTHAAPLFVSAQILPLHFLYHRSLAILMHDISTHSAPPNLLNLFQKVSSIHTYKTRSSTSKNFYTNKPNLKIQQKSFSSHGAKLWNGLPMHLRDLPKKTFKSNLTSLLFQILEEQDSYIDSLKIMELLKTK